MNSKESSEKPFDPNLLNKLPLGIAVLDKHNDNQLIFINKKAREDLQIPSELVASDVLFSSFIHPSERQKFMRTWSSDSLPKVSEWKILKPEEKVSWIQLQVTPLDKQLYMVEIRDIDKIKKISSKLSTIEAQYQALIEKDPNFLFIFKNGIIEYYNQAFIDKLGYTADEIDQRRGMPTFLVAPEHREKIARVLVESKREIITSIDKREKDPQIQRQDETIEFDLLCKDGSRVPVHAIINRVYSGKDVIIQGIMIDLSSIKELQDMKLDFLYLTQHQLRTPIYILKNSLDFYKKRIRDGLNPEEKEIFEANLIEVFSRNVDSMISLTKDLNDIALIQHSKLKCNLRGENFIPILQEVIEDLDFFLRKYRIDLIVQYPPTPLIVNLDRNRISQALRNVIENAIRFTGHGIVEVNITIQNDKYLKLLVKDNGIGIDPANLAVVGKPFVTFHPSASGLGLGLYLTKEIIAFHDGTVEILSEGWKTGTSVIISIPLLTSPENAAYSGDSSLDEIIRTASTSENMLKRMEAIHRLGNGNYDGIELDRVISTLEKVILYDKDQTIRNLASKFYSQKVEQNKNATSDAS